RYDDVIVHPPTRLVQIQERTFPGLLTAAAHGMPGAVGQKNTVAPNHSHTVLVATDRTFHNVDLELRYLRHGSLLGKSRHHWSAEGGRSSGRQVRRRITRARVSE